MSYASAWTLDSESHSSSLSVATAREKTTPVVDRRSRKISQPNNEYGQPCEGDLEETQPYQNSGRTQVIRLASIAEREGQKPVKPAEKSVQRVHRPLISVCVGLVCIRLPST